MTKTQKPPTATRCLGCHRILTSEASIKRGRGRYCEQKHRREQAAQRLTRDFKGAQAAADKALALIADKALIPTRHAGQYLAASSDGTQTYVVDTIERSCTCKGHQRVGRCYHMVAADTLELASVRRRSLTLAA